MVPSKECPFILWCSHEGVHLKIPNEGDIWKNKVVMLYCMYLIWNFNVIFVMFHGRERERVLASQEQHFPRSHHISCASLWKDVGR